KKSKKRKI
ncbi:Ditrans,polycis-undecaprenyl-diphosphate synthase ((2E,6E)-farnesyl-diphosphate specific), partial [Haemophilus influenzae]